MESFARNSSPSRRAVGFGQRRVRTPLLGRGADLAVDLGTANTVVFRRGYGVVLFEPSVVAMDEQTGRVYAVGEEARLMLGRTPATITATRPLRHGVITDFETTEQMLRQFVRRAAGRRRQGAVVICVPSGLTQVERGAVVEATLATGARKVHLIEEPLAAAIGAGLPVAEPVGSLVLDVGGGTSEMAVTALGAMVVARSLPIGGYDLDEAIVRFVHREHGLLVGQEQAEQAKLEIGSAVGGARSPGTTEIAGRDVVTGLLRRTVLSSEGIRPVLQRPLAQIVAALKELLEDTPAELAADLASGGVTLVGGGALLPGLAQLIETETGLRALADSEPLTTVARGAGAALRGIDALRGHGQRRRFP